MQQILILSKENNTEKELRIIQIEYKNSPPYAKEYLEGKIDILKQLLQNGINIPSNMCSNYDIMEVV